MILTSTVENGYSRNTKFTQMCNGFNHGHDQSSWGVLEIEPRVLYMLDEHVTTWLHPFSQSSLKNQTKPSACSFEVR